MSCADFPAVDDCMMVLSIAMMVGVGFPLTAVRPDPGDAGSVFR